MITLAAASVIEWSFRFSCFLVVTSDFPLWHQWYFTNREGQCERLSRRLDFFLQCVLKLYVDCIAFSRSRYNGCVIFMHGFFII
jgi:hypothetical protein